MKRFKEMLFSEFLANVTIFPKRV